MAVANALPLLKEKFTGSFSLACHLRGLLGEEHQYLSNLIKAITALFNHHVSVIGKTFCPEFVYELVDATQSDYKVCIKLINGDMTCKKEIVLQFNQRDELVEFETNFTY